MVNLGIKTYIKEAIKLKKNYPYYFNIWDLVKVFPHWRASLNESFNLLKDEQPWITFSAINFLEKTLSKKMKVFEYGSGGSTLFFAKRVDEVIFIENQPEWYHIVSNKLNKEKMTNWKGYLIEPQENKLLQKDNPSDPFLYLSGSNNLKERKIYFKDYVLSINNYPDKYFDFILIDGRARPSCLFHSLPKVKKGGYIMLDNSDRYYYLKETSQYLKDFEFIDFPGPSPCVNFFTRTSVWKKITEE